MMNVCVTVNSKYMRYLYVMLLSMYEHHDKGSITLYVVQNDFTSKDKASVLEISNRFDNHVAFIDVDETLYQSKSILDGLGGLKNLPSDIVCFRLLLPDLLPEDVEKILLLDVDIVVQGELTELFETYLDGYYLAAAPNDITKGIVPMGFRKWYPVDRTNWMHYNVGVLLMNLKALREDYGKEMIFNRAMQYHIERNTFDEEFFNAEWGQDKICEISADEWNHVVRIAHGIGAPDASLAQGHILHFVDVNPWGRGVKSEAYRIWWSYADRTPFASDILRETYAQAEQEVIALTTRLRTMDRILETQTQERIIQYLRENKTEEVVIYGAGRIGRIMHLFLTSGGIDVAGFIDKDYKVSFCGKPVVFPTKTDESFPEAECIIISLADHGEEIRHELMDLTKKRIVTINDILEKEAFPTNVSGNSGI